MQNMEDAPKTFVLIESRTDGDKITTPFSCSLLLRLTRKAEKRKSTGEFMLRSLSYLPQVLQHFSLPV